RTGSTCARSRPEPLPRPASLARSGFCNERATASAEPDQLTSAEPGCAAELPSQPQTSGSEGSHTRGPAATSRKIPAAGVLSAPDSPLAPLASVSAARTIAAPVQWLCSFG